MDTKTTEIRYTPIKTVTFHPTENDQILEVVRDATGFRRVVYYMAAGERRMDVLGVTEAEGMIFRGSNQSGEIWTIVGGKLYRRTSSNTLWLNIEGVPSEGSDQTWERMEFGFELPQNTNPDLERLPLSEPSRLFSLKKSLVRGHLRRDTRGPWIYETLGEVELLREGIGPNGFFSSGGNQEMLSPECLSDATNGLEAMHRLNRLRYSPEDSLPLPVTIGRNLLG